MWPDIVWFLQRYRIRGADATDLGWRIGDDAEGGYVATIYYREEGAVPTTVPLRLGPFETWADARAAAGRIVNRARREAGEGDGPLWDTEPGYRNENALVTVQELARDPYGTGMPAWVMYCLRCQTLHMTPESALATRQCPDCGPGRRGLPLTEEEAAMDPVAVLSQAMLGLGVTRQTLLAERDRLGDEVDRLRAEASTSDQ